MKKLLVFLFAMGMAIPGFSASDNVGKVPTDAKGPSWTHPSYAGSNTCLIDNSTSTRAVQCDTGSGIILDVVFSSITAGSIVFRDSATANTTSTRLYQANEGGANDAKLFPRYSNGLSANMTIAPDAGTGIVVIIFKALD